jgi:hypothetical protein
MKPANVDHQRSIRLLDRLLKRKRLQQKALNPKSAMKPKPVHDGTQLADCISKVVLTDRCPPGIANMLIRYQDKMHAVLLQKST